MTKFTLLSLDFSALYGPPKYNNYGPPLGYYAPLPQFYGPQPKYEPPEYSAQSQNVPWGSSGLGGSVPLVPSGFEGPGGSRPTTTAPRSISRQKQQVLDILKSLETGAPATLAFVHPNLIDHDPDSPGGLAGFQGIMQGLKGTGVRVNTVRIFEDGNYVFAHTDYNFFGPKFAFDIFRFENGLMVEHWDNLQVQPVKLNPSGHTMIDGATQVQPGLVPNQTESNKAIIRSFINDILVSGQGQKSSQYFQPNFTQHSPAVGDGLAALQTSLQADVATGKDVKFVKSHLVLGEGDFVLWQSEGKRATGQPVAVYDLFRLKDGKIAEHWDVLQDIPKSTDFKNPNGKFWFLNESFQLRHNDGWIVHMVFCSQLWALV